MKTEMLIELLALNAGPAPRAVVARRLVPAMLMGLMFSSVIALLVIGPLPSVMFLTPAPWIKLAYAGALAAAAIALTARLARPLAQLKVLRLAVPVVVLAMVMLGSASLMAEPDEARMAAVLGQTWWMCPWMLMGLSLPALAGILWALKGLAPTRLAHAGGASGLLAGAIGAAGYAMACPESSTSFVAVWYTLGIALTAWLGWVLGPRVLRW